MGSETFWGLPNAAKPAGGPGWESLLSQRTLPYGVEGGSPPPPPSGVFGDPGRNNIYMGQTIGPGISLSVRETKYGTRIGTYHDYFNLGSTGSSNRNNMISFIQAQLTAGRMPLASLKLNGSAVGVTGTGDVVNGVPQITWQDCRDGLLDSILDTLFGTINDNAAGKGPVIISIHSEPNGDEGTGQTATIFKQMYVHVMALLLPYPNILLAPILAGGYFEVTGGGLQFANWMSSASCHLFGYNSYNHISYVPANGKRDLTIAEAFGLQYAQMQAIDPDKLHIIGEWNVRTDPSRPGYAAQWMLDAYNYERTHQCYAMAAFDSSANVNDGGSSWALDYTGDGTDGTERYDEMETLLNLSTSKFIPLGGLAA